MYVRIRQLPRGSKQKQLTDKTPLTQPFNAFLSGFSAAVGQFVLTGTCHTCSQPGPGPNQSKPEGASVLTDRGVFSISANSDNRGQQGRLPFGLTRASFRRLRRRQSDSTVLLHQLHKLKGRDEYPREPMRQDRLLSARHVGGKGRPGLCVSYAYQGGELDTTGFTFVPASQGEQAASCLLSEETLVNHDEQTKTGQYRPRVHRIAKDLTLCKTPCIHGGKAWSSDGIKTK